MRWILLPLLSLLPLTGFAVEALSASCTDLRIHVLELTIEQRDLVIAHMHAKLAERIACPSGGRTLCEQAREHLRDIETALHKKDRELAKATAHYDGTCVALEPVR